MTKAKTHKFKAETEKVLNILTHSLYTNREIFLRELLSNASDALDKLRFLQSKGENVRDGELPLEIRITVDKDAGVLQVADTGLGMTEEEMIENLGTIAQSGSERFVKEMGLDAAEKARAGSDGGDNEPDAEGVIDVEPGETGEETPGEAPEGEASGRAAPDAASIIGRFGVGFYSVFMAANSVEVISVSARGDGVPHVWTSEGAGSFSIRALEGDEAAPYKRGTVIRAKIKGDAKDFLETYRIQGIIRKHSNFLPFPIYVGDERVNTTPAIWREPKFSITREQYADFYKYLTFDDKPPLEVIHLAVDAPVQFNALMFIPDAEKETFFTGQQEEWGLDLYARRVLIERSNNELIPQYLAFLKGVVDTEDLPLNISRETLQENIVLRKIGQTIIKQVLKHLEKIAATDKDRYARFWKLHGKYFKFAYSDYANRDRVAPLLRFASSAPDSEKSDGLTSFDEYLGRAKSGQKEIWHLAAPSAEAARVNPHLERFRRKGMEVLFLLDPVDEFALEALGSYKEHPFKAVDRAEVGDLEAFADLESAAPPAPALSDDEKSDLDKLLAKMRGILGEQVKDVRVSERLSGGGAGSESSSPALLVSAEGMSSSMERLMRAMRKDEEIPQKILELNPDHPLVRTLLRIYHHEPENPLLTDLTLSLFDNVRLLDGYAGDPYLMADRNLRLLDKAVAWYADLLEKR